MVHQRLMPTESAQQALSILRDPSNFQWYVIPFLLIVIYIDHDQIGRGNWSVVFAGLALWGMDWFNEICVRYEEHTKPGIDGRHNPVL